MEEIQKILIRRGPKSRLPKLDEGEFGLCTDTNPIELYIGTRLGNKLVTNNSVVNIIASINGSIKVNGVDIVVYDDTDIKNQLSNKANLTHNHVISNIDGLVEALNAKSDKGHFHSISDITNLIETLNSKSNVGHKHVMSDITDLAITGATKLSDMEDIDFTVLPFEGDVLKYINGSWSAGQVSGVGNSGSSDNYAYYLELSRWGIRNDGTDAVNTTQGINDAIAWANLQGYSEITFPKGTYLIDETKSILPKSFMTINLNGAKLRVRDNNLEGYIAVKFDNVAFSRITNGLIEGDRDTHTYTIDGVGADTHEGGTGINILGSKFISIDNLEIYNMTGDACNTTNKAGTMAFNLKAATCEVGGYDGTTGQPIVATNRIRWTNKLDLQDPLIASYGSFTLGGNGYQSLGAGITTRFVDIMFYKSDDTFMSSLVAYPIFSPIIPPKGAKWAKIVLHQGTIPADVDNSLLVWNINYAQNIFFDKINIHDCRRQGLSLQGRYIYVRDSEIHHIGGATFQTGTDPQGGIDIEDGSHLNQHYFIERNNFHDNWGYDLVITSGKHMYIDGNRFNKISKYVTIAFNYNIDYSSFTNNFIYNGKIMINGDVHLSGNHFYGSSVIFGDGTTTQKSIEVNDAVFHNCNVTLNHGIPYNIKMDGCKFKNDTDKLNSIPYQYTISARTEPQTFSNCSFDGDDVVSMFFMQNTKPGWIFENCIFNNTKGITFPAGLIKNSRINTAGILAFSTNTTDTKIEILDSHIKTTDTNNSLFSINGIKNLRIEGCTLEKSDSEILTINDISDRADIRNNIITYTSGSLNKPVFTINNTFTGNTILIDSNKIISAASKNLIIDSLIDTKKVSIINNILKSITITRKNESFINNIIDGIIDSKSDMYVIELSRWGITQGLPAKRLETINGVSVNCYADADYTIAHNNVIGINNALQWASDNGYKNVILPKGDYSYCYSYISDNDKENTIVVDYDNFIFDLNGSTIKVMYDSSKRSQYDKLKVNGSFVTSTNPIYYFCGMQTSNRGVIVVRDCNFTTVRNGKIIGDRIDREFTIQDEKGKDITYGIQGGGNCKYCTIENMDVGFFMGDNMSISNGIKSLTLKNGYQMGWTVGNLDSSGLAIVDTTHCVSDYIAISSKTSYFLQGYGFTQGLTGLKNKKYSIYCYDSSKVFIKKLPDTFVLREFTTTKSTAYIKLVVEEIAVDVDGWQMTLRNGIYGSYLIYKNNYIHHAHRGGMTPGVNDMFIINNHFYNNGEQYDYEYNLPGFEQPNGQQYLTRYHINMEDTQAYNLNVIGNHFEGSRISIAMRGWDWTIKDNTFKNNLLIAYKVRHLNVTDNYFEGSAAFDTFNYNIGENFTRNWDIKGNVFEGSFNLEGTLPVDSVTGNLFKGSVTADCDISKFSGNTFKVEADAGFNDQVNLTTVSVITDCSFDKLDTLTVKNSVRLENSKIIDCTFRNVKVKVKDVELVNTKTQDTGFVLTGGYFKTNGCRVNQGTYTIQNNYAIAPDNSAFLIINDATNNFNVEMRNTDIISTSTQNIFSSPSLVKTKTNLKLNNVTIIKQVNNKIGLEVFDGALDLNNTTIASDVAVTAYNPSTSFSHKYIDCTFTNVSFTAKTSDLIYKQSDINILANPLTGTTAPSSTPQKIGQEYYDTTNKKLYKAFGVSSSTDWIIMN
jgi:hypothetical protein